MKVLVIDIGGSHVKVAVANADRRARFDSSSGLTPVELVSRTVELTSNWTFDVISIGYPGVVADGVPAAEPGNLGRGWVGFDFARPLGRPVRIVNDAALQALGAYDGGRMLFLGLGTGVGSALISERVIVPLELGELTTDAGATLAARVGRSGLESEGIEVWRRTIGHIVPMLRRAFVADYVVLGGGHAKHVDPLPDGARLGGNEDAIAGGYRLWRDVVEPHDRRPSAFWRVVQ